MKHTPSYYTIALTVCAHVYYGTSSILEIPYNTDIQIPSIFTIHIATWYKVLVLAHYLTANRKLLPLCVVRKAAVTTDLSLSKRDTGESLSAKAKLISNS
jgi:hypothetical protein